MEVGGPGGRLPVPESGRAVACGADFQSAFSGRLEACPTHYGRLEVCPTHYGRLEVCPTALMSRWLLRSPG